MKLAIVIFLGLICSLPGTPALAHPGSGIVADRQGNVYFVDTGSGVWKLSRDGTLTRLQGPAYHWMGADLDNRLKNVDLPYFASGGATVTRVGTDPTLILSSDFPVAVGRDGSLFYPRTRDEELLQIFRLDTSGATAVFATLSSDRDSTTLRWVNGAAAGPDGLLYYTEDAAIRSIDRRGTVSTVIGAVSLPDCKAVPGISPADGPYLRGLDIGADGSVYVAATGCGAVLKISPGKKVTTLLKSSGPWSPTGVALSGADLYVLEYFHTPGDDRREWIPRVKKVTPDGKVVTVATIERK